MSHIYLVSVAEFLAGPVELKDYVVPFRVYHFTFEHLPSYQEIQFKFIEAVESLDHNNIVVSFISYRLIKHTINQSVNELVSQSISLSVSNHSQSVNW